MVAFGQITNPSGETSLRIATFLHLGLRHVSRVNDDGQTVHAFSGVEAALGALPLIERVANGEGLPAADDGPVDRHRRRTRRHRHARALLGEWRPAAGRTHQRSDLRHSDADVQRLRAAARKAAADPAVVQTITRTGSPIEYLDAPDLQAYWDADAKTMVDAVRRIGKVE